MIPNRSNRRVVLLFLAGLLGAMAAWAADKPMPPAKEGVMNLTNEDLPPDPAAAVVEVAQKLHAVLADGNTTKALTLLASVPADRAAKAALQKRLGDQGRALAQGKWDFIAFSAIVDEDCAMAFIGQIALINGSVWVTPEPMFFVQEGDTWKAIPDPTAFRSGGSVSGITARPAKEQQVARMNALNEIFRVTRFRTMEERYGPDSTAQEIAERVESQRTAMWAAGGSAKKPPKLTPLF